MGEFWRREREVDLVKRPGSGGGSEERERTAARRERVSVRRRRRERDISCVITTVSIGG